ncbi:uncharacterized protein LOC144350401 [Saccoglossus kowalevskii]
MNSAATDALMWISSLATGVDRRNHHANQSESETSKQLQLLATFAPMLKERLIPTTILAHLGTLLSQDVLSDIQRIHRIQGQRAAVNELLEQLHMSSVDNPGWFRMFMDALRESDNAHLADYIEGTSTDNLEEFESFKRIIRICAPRLESIIPSQILPYLTSLNNHDTEQIFADERNYGPRQAAFTLICRVLQKGGEWFREFTIIALREVGRSDLAELLDPDGKICIGSTEATVGGAASDVNADPTDESDKDSGRETYLFDNHTIQILNPTTERNQSTTSLFKRMHNIGTLQDRTHYLPTSEDGNIQSDEIQTSNSPPNSPLAGDVMEKHDVEDTEKFKSGSKLDKTMKKKSVEDGEESSEQNTTLMDDLTIGDENRS